MKVLSPAKLNLMLHVVGRREDGYHLLQTVFQLIDLCDTLYFTKREDGQIIRKTRLPFPAENDLIMKAAKLLKEKAQNPSLGVEIKIDKKIPMGGGLGGGSSNAATTLLALNALWDLNFTKEELLQFGLTLGADVPFFIFGENAIGEGIGEKLTPIDLDDATFCIIYPNISVETKRIFGAKELTRDSETIKIMDFPNYWKQGLVKNDLQPVVEKCCRPVKEALDWLSAFGPSQMTGSGSCVFVKTNEAEHILEKLPKSWTGYKAKGLKKHPFYV